MTENGDKAHDLSGPRRIELGTYHVKIDSRHNRVQFLFDDHDGKPSSSAWYEIVGERQDMRSAI
jgi:hypothetical protein